MFYTIYKITNLLTNEIYVGQHSTKRIDDRYYGSSKRLIKDIKRFGRKSFQKEILFIFDNYNDMNQKEIELVTKDFCMRADTYNLAPGGKCNMHLSPEFRSARSALGRRAANANGAHVKGRERHSELLKTDPEYRAKYDLKTWNTRRGQTGTFTGKTHNDDTKAKMSASKQISSKGSRNSQFGTCWMHKDNKNCKVKKEDVAIYLEQDYIKGRI